MVKEIARQDRIVDLTRRFIQIPSTSENSIARSEVLDEAAKSLTGFTREQFESEGVRSDLYYIGDSRPSKFRVLLLAHLDVVPAQDPLMQYTPRIEGRRLIGRGAEDMKSGAAALIDVFSKVASKVSYPLGLSLTTDEELGGNNGAGYQVNQGVKADFVLSGEPTDLAIGNQHKGVLIIHSSHHTDGGHVAYNGENDNALLQEIKFLYGVIVNPASIAARKYMAL